MIGLAFKAFGAAGFLMKAAVIGSILLSLLTIYGVWHHRVYQSGVNDTIAKIAKADAETIKKATTARNTFKNCRDTGRNWDQSSGACR